MYVVMTQVTLQPDTQERCADLFHRTNPELVSAQSDWLGARMLFEPETHKVTVLATWRSVEAYRQLSATPEFQNTMQDFAAFFAAPPQVSEHEVLVDMAPADLP